MKGQPSTFQEIERHLASLGAGNHPDNLDSLRHFSNYYLTSLSETEFFNLVFLQNDEVVDISPRGEDRRLLSVASRALRLGQLELSDNWDLGDIGKRIRSANPGKHGFQLPALVLRDARGSETKRGGRWYLQDGSHRALAYAMVVLNKEAEYQTQAAYCATDQFLPIESGKDAGKPDIGDRIKE